MKIKARSLVSLGGMIAILVGASYGTMLAQVRSTDPANILLNAVLSEHNCPPPNNKDYIAAYNELSHYLAGKGIRFTRDQGFRKIQQGFFRKSLHNASLHGSKTLVKILLECGLSIDIQDTLRNTPLHVALKYGQSDTAQALIEHGASVNIRNSFGQTPLYLASKAGDTKLVRLLLEHGSDASIPDNNRNTPLHAAANAEIVARLMATLLQNNQDIAPKNLRGEIPLTVALKSYILNAKPSLRDVIQFLIQFGVPLSNDDITKLDNLFPNWRQEWLESKEKEILQRLEPYLDPRDLRRLLAQFLISSRQEVEEQ